MLDSRFIKTSHIYEISKASYEDELAVDREPSKYYNLEPFETFHGKVETSILSSTLIYLPITVPSDGMMYEIYINTNIDPTEAENIDIKLWPNNTISTLSVYKSCLLNTNVSPYVKGWYSDVINSLEVHAEFNWNTFTPSLINITCCPNPIDKKYIMSNSGTLNGVSTSHDWWNDITTQWNKLGTIQYYHLTVPGTLGTLITTPVNAIIECFIKRIM